MGKRYKLKKDLPTFNAGDIFELRDDDLYYADGDPQQNNFIMAYSWRTLVKFPNILIDWFEEIPEKQKTVYDLGFEDRYYYIDNYGRICKDKWDSLGGDYKRRETGNVFLTVEEAEHEIEWLKAREILKRDTKGFKPDWKNHRQNKCGVYFNNFHEQFFWISWAVNTFNEIVFSNDKDAEESIKKHEKEWKIYLRVGE